MEKVSVWKETKLKNVGEKRKGKEKKVKDKEKRMKGNN